eukprot:scaffold2690_cov429-Pavlova_lutheri.AAC.1
MTTQLCLEQSNPCSDPYGVVGRKFCDVQASIPIVISTESIYKRDPHCKHGRDIQGLHEIAPVCAGEFRVSVHDQIAGASAFRDPVTLKLKGQLSCSDAGGDRNVDGVFGKPVYDVTPLASSH